MVAVLINAIVGAGIFGLPSRVHALVGPYGLLAFIACGLVVAAICLCFAEVASRFVQTGGPYLYTRQALGPVPGFVVGWLMWVTRMTSLGAIANVMISYLAHFRPSAEAGPERALLIGAVVVALSVVLLIGVRESAGTVAAFTVGKLVPLALFVGVGLFALDPGNFTAAVAPAPGALAQAVLLLIFAFGGFEGAVVLAGESKDPRRDLPAALFMGIAAVTLLYILIQVVCIGTLPGLATSTRPLADAAAGFMGTAGATVVTLGALISTIGTMFSVLLLGPRVLYAMAEQQQLPALFGATHRRFRTPHVAIVITSLIALALALSGTFTYLVGLSVITRLAIYLATAVAFLVLRRRKDAPPAQVSVPWGNTAAALAIAACAWLLTNSEMRELRDSGIAIAVGLGLHGGEVLWRRRRSSLPSPDRAA